MLVGERSVGVLGVLTRAPRQFGEEDRELLEIFAATAATALENARLYAEAGRAEKAARAKAEELATLHEVGTRLAATLDVQAVLEAVAESAARLIGAHRAVVFELDANEQRLRPRVVAGATSDRPIMGPRVGQGASGSAVVLRRPVFSADVDLEPTPGFDARPDGGGQTLREVFRAQSAVLAVPLMSRQEVMGALAVFWEDVHPRDEDEIRLLTALARQAALAIDSARLYGEAQRRLRETAALLDIARAIAST